MTLNSVFRGLKNLSLSHLEEDFLASRTFVAPEESNATKSIVEDLEQAVLIEHLPDRKVYSGTGLTPELRKKFIQFLIDNIDYFAWSHLDMTGISPEITSHRLSVDPRFKPVKRRASSRRERYAIPFLLCKPDLEGMPKLGTRTLKS